MDGEQLNQEARYLRQRLVKMDDTYRDRWPRWTNRDYIAVHIVLAALQPHQAKPEEKK